MKKISLILILFCFSVSSFCQLAQWKKQVIKGSVMTGVGAGMIGASGGFFIPYGAVLLIDPIDGDDVVAGGALLGAGCVLLAGGIALDIVGPIMIARGVKRHKDGDDTYLQFSPMPPNYLLNKYDYAFTSKQKFAALTLTF